MTQQEEQLFAVRWCLARAAEHVEKSNILASPVGHPLDLVVNGVNITRTILDVLDMIDPARTKAAVSGDWIPVTERLPEHGGTVVCRTRDRQLAFGRAMRWCEQRGGERHEKYHWMGYPDGSLDVAHWAPLPEPPEDL